MDTPERTQIANPNPNPISMFEDSPVFNYINSLSPIKPVKSILVTQTFGSLTFASLPSIFASPQVNSHKELRFLKRRRDLDLENDQDRPENENKTTAIDSSVNDTSGQNNNEEELQGNFDGSINVGETSVDPVDDSFEFVIELPQTLKYDCGSPNCDLTSPETNACGVAQEPDDSHLEQHTENYDSENKRDAEGISGQKEGPMQISLDGSNTKSTDILIFSSPSDAIAFHGLVQTSPDLSTGLLTSMGLNAPQYETRVVSEKRQLLQQVTSGEQYETEDPSLLPSEAHFPDGNSLTEMDECLNEGEDGDAEALVPFGYKMSVNLRHGVRRRCLDFKVAEPLQRSDSSLALQQFNDDKSSKDKRLILVKPGVCSSKKPVLPGIGLHLNALTSSAKTIEQETILPDASSQLSITDHENLNPMTSENEMDPAVNGLQLTEYDPTDASMLNQLSPQMMRRRDLNGEPEVCKRCNCKKSKCLKLYCECFAAGVYCIEPCACQDCLNKPIHEEIVLATRKQIESRNPLAFAPKVIRTSDSMSEVGDESNKTPASARHKRGCNCKKSNCLKKYCECFQGGVGCSINCRCEGCKNAFGTKDGSITAGADCEMEEDSEKCEKRVVDQIGWTTDGQKNLEQNDSLLSTLSKLDRPALPIGFPPKTKQLRSSLLNVRSSYSIQPSQRMKGSSGFLWPLSKFDKQPLQTNPEDGIPNILCGSTPTIGIIKVTSPKGKRVSTPHADSFSSSPGQQTGGRRLILRSIPAFPSLAPHD